MTPDRPAKADQIWERSSALELAVPAPILHQEVEVLERKEPSYHPGICVFGPGHPLKGRVFCNEGELTAQEVVAQLQDCPLDGQSFLLHAGVILLGRGQLPADIKDRMLLIFLNLGQDGWSPGPAGPAPRWALSLHYGRPPLLRVSSTPSLADPSWLGLSGGVAKEEKLGMKQR